MFRKATKVHVYVHKVRSAVYLYREQILSNPCPLPHRKVEHNNERCIKAKVGTLLTS